MIGSPPPEHPPAGERGESRSSAIRTFLIGDVRGYTLFTQERGDEAAAKLAARFAEIARDVIEGRGGAVTELRGDEVLAVFDSPRQAIRAAVELQEALVEETLANPELPLLVGIGLDAGEAVPMEGGWRGGALNLAARLCGQAGPGEVLASREVVHLARRIEGLRYLERGALHLKGLAEPVRPVQVVPEENDPAKRLSTVVRPAVPAPSPATAETPSHPLLSRRRLLVAALAVVVLAAAVSVFLLRGDRGVEGLAGLDGTALGFVDLETGALLEQIPLTRRPGGVAVGEGAVWVTDAVAGTVGRIDLESRHVVDTIQVDNGPAGIAVGEGAVWVTNSDAGSVSRINPRTNEVVQRITVGNGPTGIAVGEGAVWVTNSFDATVTRIDVATSRVTATVGVGGGPRGIAVGEGFVWVANQSSGTVSRIDPGAGMVGRPINVGNAPTGVAVGEGAVWVTNTGDETVSEIDAPSGTVSATVPVGRGPGGVAVGGGSAWVANELGASVARVDPGEDRVIGTVRLGSAPQAVAVGDGGLWVVARGSTADHRGGTLRVVDDAGPFGIDPATSFDIAGWQVLSMTNDGLVGFKRVGGAEGVTLVPNLAASLPVPTNAGRTYTFLLRPGLRYSTGEPVTAADIRRGIERGFRVPEGTAPFFVDRIVGADRCLEDPAACDLGQGIVVDEQARTITFHLVEPDPAFLHKLTMPLGFAVPDEVPAGEEATEPVPATGPYMIERFVPGEEILLARNPMFQEWSPTARPDGYPDEIAWELGVDPSAQVDAVAADEADVMAGQLVPPERLDEINTAYTDRRYLYAEASTFYLAMNTSMAPFDDLRVRRAVNLAVDRERVVELVGGPFRAQLTCQILPPNFPGYRPYCTHTFDPDETGTWKGPDLDAARGLVEASGTEGMEITLWSLPLRFLGVGGYMADVLRELGYVVTLEERDDPGVYFSHINNSENRVHAMLVGWFVDIPVPLGMFTILRCDSFVPGVPFNNNHAQFCDPDIDALMDEASSIEVTDPPAANALWAEVDRRLVDAAPLAPLFNRRGMDLVSTLVGNYQRHPQWAVLLDQLWVQ